MKEVMYAKVTNQLEVYGYIEHGIEPIKVTTNPLMKRLEFIFSKEELDAYHYGLLKDETNLL